MKKKKMLILAIQIILIIGFSLSFFSYIQSEVEPMNAYIYTRDMPSGSKITVDDIKVVSIPRKAFVSKDFALNSADIIGRYTNTKVYKGHFVYESQLEDLGSLDPLARLDLSGYRKIGLAVDYVTGLGGDLRRGDRVDLAYTGEGKTKADDGMESTFVYSKIFMQDIPVVNVLTTDGYQFQSHANSTESDTYGEGQVNMSTGSVSGELGVVILAVTPAQYEEIRARMKTGEVSLVGRFEESENYETLGYVIGEYGKIFSGNANAETSQLILNQKAQLNSKDDNTFEFTE